MLSLVKRALEPNSAYSDKILFLSSVGLHQSVSSNTDSFVNAIQELITTSHTKIQGLQALGIGLEQSPSIYASANWMEIVFDILQDTGSSTLKQLAFSVLCILIPSFAKDCSPVNLKNFKKDVVPFLMDNSDQNTEWSESACKCLNACLQFMPQVFYSHVNRLEEIIFKQVSCNVSSGAFEIYAMCFAELPHCYRDCQSKDRPREYFFRALKTIQVTLSSFFSLNLTDWTDPLVIGDGLQHLETVEQFKFMDDNDKTLDGFSHPMKGVRRFINLCKCLAKLLSLKFTEAKKVPSKEVLYCLAPILRYEERPSNHNIEKEVLSSNLASMQLAACSVLEVMMSKLSTVMFSGSLCKILSSLLKSSKQCFGSDSVGELRFAVWKLLGLYASQCGSSSVTSVTSPEFGILDELLYDISIVVKESSQSTTPKANQKSKSHGHASNMPGNSENKKYGYVNQHSVCKEALKTLEAFLYAGTLSVNGQVSKVVEQKILQVIRQLQNDYKFDPFPYDDDSCRKYLYSVLVAIIVLSRPNELSPLGTAGLFLQKGLRDSSSKVVKTCQKGLATTSLSLHPNRPSAEALTNNPRESKPKDNKLRKIYQWETDAFVPDLSIEDLSDTPEASTSGAQTFHNADESELQSEEYMDIQQRYSEHDSENQCNGTDILIQEVQSSSQCQDEESEDEAEEEEEEEEEDEEEDERSYGDEEMNQDEVHSDNMYIPSASKLQVLNPVHMSPERAENVIETEYEELRPCAKTEGDIVDNSSKNMHLNGVHSIVPDPDTPSSSTQPTVTNENGMCESAANLLNEQGVEVDEEEGVSFSEEKRVTEFYDPPLKRQKVDADEVNEELETEEREQNSKSPTLSEMKADFCCNDIDDVKS